MATVNTAFATLNKVFEDMLAVSKGDAGTLSRATKEFVCHVTAPANQMPRESQPAVLLTGQQAPAARAREKSAFEKA